MDLDFVDPLKVFPLNRFIRNWRKRELHKNYRDAITNILNKFDGEYVEYVTHECPLSFSHEKRFALALDLLKKYAHARLVITSRIHCALPCLGLGTPVILARKSYDNGRFQGLDRFLNHIWIDDKGKLLQHIDTSYGEIINSDEFRKKANTLRERCTEFAKVNG